MDLQDRIARLGGTIEPPSVSAVSADLARGHRALRRRRTAQTVAGSAFGLAAVVAAFSFTATTAGSSPDAGPALSQPPAVSSVAGGGLQLVDYRGEQPRFFTIDTVPEGFFVQDASEWGLMLAPLAAQNPGPDVDPSKDPLYDPHVYTGKIGVYLEHKLYRGEVSGDTITINGHRAIYHTIGPTIQILIEQSDEVWSTVQYDVAISRTQAIEVASGIHVTPEAIAAVTSPDDVPKANKD